MNYTQNTVIKLYKVKGYIYIYTVDGGKDIGFCKERERLGS
jgi:hypothetical protein